ncbi:motility associated factor glycosyltransferase family protein [Azospirillum palustre]
MSETTLLARNLAFLASAPPSLREALTAAARVAGRPATAARTVSDAALACARTRVECFLSSPETLNAPMPVNNEASAAAAEAFFGSIRSLCREGGHPAPPTSGALMVLLGVGDGLELEDLLDRLPLERLILVEERAEDFRDSLETVDWQALSTRLDGNIEVVLCPDAHRHLFLLFALRGSKAYPLLDGVLVYKQRSSPVLDEVHRLLHERWTLMLGPLGNHEEQLIMTEQALTNLQRYRPRLLAAPLPELSSVPAAVVGSGPSLDHDIAVLREHQDRIVIFSCGSSLVPLLRAGVRPDFHCELERGEFNYQALLSAQQEHDFTGITLVASSTIWPETGTLFDSHIFLMRHGMMPTSLLNGGAPIIRDIGPTVANLGFAAAIGLGFRDIISLWGVDLGTRQKDRHHSSNSFWVTDDSFVKYHDEAAYPFDIPQPANFGGIAQSTPLLLWAQIVLQLVAEHMPVRRALNCSDGVRIPGIEPMAARDFADRFAKAPKHEAVRQVLQSQELRSFAFPPRPEVSVELDRLSPLLAELRAILADAASHARPVSVLTNAAVAAIGRATANSPAAEWLAPYLEGDILSLLKGAHYLLRRTPPDQQEQRRAWLLERMGESIARIEAASAARFPNLLDRLPER